jgi:hypothetical protein
MPATRMWLLRVLNMLKSRISRQRLHIPNLLQRRRSYWPPRYRIRHLARACWTTYWGPSFQKRGRLLRKMGSPHPWIASASSCLMWPCPCLCPGARAQPGAVPAGPREAGAARRQPVRGADSHSGATRTREQPLRVALPRLRAGLFRTAICFSHGRLSSGIPAPLSKYASINLLSQRPATVVCPASHVSYLSTIHGGLGPRIANRIKHGPPLDAHSAGFLSP